VSGNGPDQSQTGEKGWNRFFDDLKVTDCNALKLALKCVQKLHEILGNSLLFLENSILGVVVFKAVAVILLIMRGHDVDDPFDLRHVQLLIQRVESRVSLSPILNFSLS